MGASESETCARWLRLPVSSRLTNDGDRPHYIRGRVIDVTDKSYTVELTGDQSKNDAFLEAIDRSAILETVRTGACGIGRGERILRV